jgi:hypothetical protein
MHGTSADANKCSNQELGPHLHSTCYHGLCKMWERLVIQVIGKLIRCLTLLKQGLCPLKETNICSEGVGPLPGRPPNPLSFPRR